MTRRATDASPATAVPNQSISATVGKGSRRPQRLSALGKIPRGVSGKADRGISKTAIEKDISAHGLRIEYRDWGSLRAYERNSRTHSAKQIAAIEASLSRYGWTTPIAIADDVVLAGHARLRAAANIYQRQGVIARHGDLRMVPTVDLSALSPIERKAYVIADNKIAEAAGWDNDLLRLEMFDLKTDGFDLSLTGFSGSQAGVILGLAEDTGGRKFSDGMRYQVVVDCEGEEDQAALLERFKAEGLKVRPLIL